VFAFHGYVNTADEMFYDNGWGQVANDNDFIVVTPDGANDDGGLGQSWNAGGCSSSPLVGGATCDAEKAGWDDEYC
jgi:poly(3-hydroxybutyrate) depolymerase